MLPILQLGPLALQTPGLILILGLWLGLNLAEKNAHRHHVHPDNLYNLTFTALIAGIVGARLAYIARYSSAFIASPASLFSLNPGLLDPFGGIAVGLLAALIFGQRKKLAFWPTLDALTPVLTVMSIAFALANLASGDAFGAETTLPWGIELWGAKRHPAQLYEALAAGCILLLLWPARGVIARRISAPGAIFVLFLALSAGAHLFLEAFRGDSAILPNGWRIAQILAWFLLAGSLWGFEKLTNSTRTLHG
ncbi:MAG: prolipoprotein diacylglyceryl transferase [Anaerolineales bacterium]|nr:prolipoprotein diacylglyceryl transferase [Anaerolineales bacterium]